MFPPAPGRLLALSPPAAQRGAVCRISHSSRGYRTWLPLLHRPTSAGQCGLPRRAGRSWFPIWPTRFRQDALAAGGGDDRVGLRDGQGTHVAGQPNQRGRDGVLSMQFLMLPVLRSSDRPSSVIFTTAPRSAATAGLAFSSSRSSSKSQSPSISWSGSSWWRLLSLRRSPAYWAPCST